MADNEKLGSTSPQILLKNATNLDKLVNGRESESLPDRFAVLRRTWYGMEMAFNRFITYITGRGEQAVGAIGWQELGNWATGLTVDNRQQIVYYNGSWYKYLGELEHVITGDSPENDGGVWSAENPTGKWSNIGDAALRSNLGSSEEGMGDDIVTHSDGKTVREHIKYLERDKLSFYGSTATGLMNFLAYASASGRECIVDTVVNLTVAVNFDAQFSNIHLRWEAPINSDTQLFNLHNLGPKSILKDMWFQNITAPWVINRWDTDGNWIDNAENIANSVVQTNEEAGYQPTASDKDVWPLLSDTVKNQQICGGPIIHTSRGVSVLNPRGRYIAITFMDCNFCTVSEPSVMGGKHQYGTILFNNTGTTAWGKGNKVIDGEVRYGSTSGV
ncbi:tail spike protein, partial [Klebsiella michiganensis]|uniref:tail spike protein n=1 Tax=Klebsiella michiganensis TaxID=1134687 RepID=UPI0011E46421